uniref:Piwi domain-containing protein n=1 Tax=Syphacia muris TaxID=451379 RepID=A0A0N5AXQ2_9BILA
MLLLRRALEMYRLLNESGAYLYDLSSSLFTNEPLNKDELPELTIRYEQMTAELKYLMGEVDVTIEISPCADNAHTFNIADYRTSVTNDLSCQDHSLRQFFEIMTNTSALQKGTHYAFGSGKLFMLNGKEFGLPEKPLSECRTLVTGADKGVRFIEGGEAGVVPALILDCNGVLLLFTMDDDILQVNKCVIILGKKAAFFDSCSLTEMVKSILLRSDADAPLPKVYGHLFSEFQRKIGDVVRDLRLEHIDNTRQSFVASGLSDKPVEQIMMKVHKRRDAINMLEYYREQGIRLRSDLPAVRLTTPFGTTYFPIELLRVASRQRVPLSKQTAWQMKDVIKECATPPTVRFHEILKNLKALDLSDGARFNPFMAAFGVRVSLKPLKKDLEQWFLTELIKGHRRSAPTVRYLSSRHGSSKAEVDIRNVCANLASCNLLGLVKARLANWRMADREYLIGAELNTWYILYDDDRDRAIIMTFKEALVYECRRRGIRATDPEVRCVPFEEIESFFKRIRKEHPKRRVFVMYVDGKDGNHDDLKLMEVLYRIITQHVRVIRAREAPRKPTVLENIINKINCKNFGQCYAVVPEQFSATKWISNGKTLIIGYDVCHPDPQPKHERRLKLPPTQPSVIGISFNGALCPETFIGDYAFQQPRQEQATSSILEERICWILGLFLKNRGSLPDTIIVTRDGVSEGQFKMVMEEEVEALRSGIRNFADSMRISNYSPPIVCIIACKRHNKRFAIDNGRGYENCLPLTVIDKDITRPDMTEFFMQAHKVIKGTGKLPAYSVPINEANLSMDEVQSLMLALCFTHQIVNQAISIPEPIYQADEWAKRGRNNFKAMMRRAGGRERLPMLSKEEVDWQKVTLKLCYMNSELQLTRINA